MTYVLTVCVRWTTVWLSQCPHHLIFSFKVYSGVSTHTNLQWHLSIHHHVQPYRENSGCRGFNSRGTFTVLKWKWNKFNEFYVLTLWSAAESDFNMFLFRMTNLLLFVLISVSVERRRRFNINDRIKELGALVPKTTDPSVNAPPLHSTDNTAKTAENTNTNNSAN